MENNLYVLPMESDKIDLVSKAFIAAGGEFVKPDKDKRGNYGSYSSLEGILDSVKEPLSKYGLRFFQRRHRIMGEDILVSTLLHESGQWLKSYAGLPIPATSKREVNQDVGAAITYQCRYEAPIFLGLADADPDNDPDKPVVTTSGHTEQIQTNLTQSGTISDKQLGLLKMYLKSQPDREAKLCAHYKINDLSELSWKYMNEVVAALKPKE